jgi:hypothetical protein
MRIACVVIVIFALCVADCVGKSKSGNGISKLLKEGRAARNNQDMQVRLRFSIVLYFALQTQRVMLSFRALWTNSSKLCA